MKVYAPGKLILSGEHAVVHGHPALAMAVNRYVIARVTRERLPNILFDLSDLAHRSQLSFAALHDLKSRIKRKYHKFIRGEYSIREVLHKPFELAQFALGVFAETLNVTIPHGVKIHVQSDIPIGCGMGSSAATILSVMQAISNHLQIPLSTETLFNVALEAENMQHGHSSGLDLRVALSGGCLYLHDGKINARMIPTCSMYLINTGAPITSTGECVEKVTTHFQHSQIGHDFAAVTNALDQAFQQNQLTTIYSALRVNHQLLVRIGVVPEKIQQFVAAIEAAEGAAKICGAGAVMGDQAGAVLVMINDESKLSMLCQQYGYQWTRIMGETRGIHVV